MLRERNEFYRNDFSGADLVKADFRGGVDLTRQRLPTGGDYLYLPDAQAASERARSLLRAQKADGLTAKVEFFPGELMEREIGLGQHQAFMRKSDFASRKGVDPTYCARI